MTTKSFIIEVLKQLPAALTALALLIAALRGQQVIRTQEGELEDKQVVVQELTDQVVWMATNVLERADYQ